MNKRIFLTGCAALLLAATASVAAPDLWLHVKVGERGRGSENVNINIPLSMIEALLPMIETDEFRGGRVNIGRHLDDEVFQGLDLRKVLEALRDAPDADFITVRSDDENVRVAKERGVLRIDVDDRYESEKVRVTIPLAIVEAMIDGDGDEIDILAGVRALAAHGAGDLITVESDDETVRIWVDDRQSID